MLVNYSGYITSVVLLFISLNWWQSLPPIWLLGVFAFSTLVLHFVLKKPFALCFILYCLCYLLSFCYFYKTWQPSRLVYSQPVIIHAIVDEVQTNLSDSQGAHTAQTLRFNAKIKRLGKRDLLFKPKIRLSWQKLISTHPTTELNDLEVTEFGVKKGDLYKLLVDIKHPSGLANPDGFSYQKWLAAENIIATAYVKESPSNQLLSRSFSLRQALLDKMQRLPFKFKAELIALSLGEKSAISKQTWTLIQQSGIAHLFAISGLHLGVVSMFVLMLCKPLVALLSLVVCQISAVFKSGDIDSVLSPVRVNHISLAICFLCAGFYAYLAGFELPVTRALVAVFLLTLSACLISYRRVSMSILYLLFLCLLLMPMSVLSLSFWFSFNAVFIICFILWRLNKASKGAAAKLLTACKLQLILCALTLPLVAYHFQIVSIVSPVANFIAVPVISLLVVPLCMLGLICLIFDSFEISFYFFALADRLISGVVHTLEYILAFDFSVFEVLKPSLSAVVLVFLALILLSLPFWPHKQTLSLTLILPLVSYFMPEKAGFYSIHVFDVGHGLSAFVKSRSVHLLYDTGASYPSGFSIANAVVHPFMKANGIKKIDHVFISHHDIDHSGGVDYLKQNKLHKNLHDPSDTCNSSSNPNFKHLVDDFELKILWPRRKIQDAENDDSCVLKLSHRESKTSVLLTGDIEKSAEASLIQLHKDKVVDLSADILIAPHHGSRTSSSVSFIKLVQPRYVVFSSRYNGRWNLPNQEVVNRYEALDSEILHTGKHGRIVFEIDTQISYRKYRQDEANYWFLKP